MCNSEKMTRSSLELHFRPKKGHSPTRMPFAVLGLKTILPIPSLLQPTQNLFDYLL